MTKDQCQELLKEKNQSQVLAFVGELDDAKKEELFAQIEAVDFDMLKLAQNPKEFPKGKMEALDVVDIDAIAAKESVYKAEGLKAIKDGKVAAVLLAGGMGTRLGFDKPKGCFNVGKTKDLYIFECLVNNLLDVTNEAGAYIPLYIMTSEKNHEDTVSFFEEKNYFGYPKTEVAFFKQEMAPAVDFDGNLLMEEKGRLATSPNGNGGWYSSLMKAGLDKDLHKRGVEWINIFAVDNVLQRICDPIFVGATLLGNADSGAKVVRKVDAHEKMGVICLEDGRPSVVEYYEMTPEEQELTNEKGELVYNFGVILNYLFKVDKLEEIVSKSLPVHIVKKKIPFVDEAGNLVSPEEPNGYKFETLVVDMIRLLNTCVPFEVVREKEFAPIKNLHGVDSLDSARELLEKNGVNL